jgi:hypothetical protein
MTTNCRAIVANCAVPANGRQPQRFYTVRKSRIHGRGVFATVEIRKGTTILEYKGRRSSWKEALERADSDPNDPSHTFLFELDDGMVIDASIGGNAARWVNPTRATPIAKLTKTTKAASLLNRDAGFSPRRNLPTTIGSRFPADCPSASLPATLAVASRSESAEGGAVRCPP